MNFNLVTYTSSASPPFPPLLLCFIHQQRKEEKLKQSAGVDLVKTNIYCHINRGKPLSLSPLFLLLLTLCCFFWSRFFTFYRMCACLSSFIHGKPLISEIWEKITNGPQIVVMENCISARAKQEEPAFNTELERNQRNDNDILSFFRFLLFCFPFWAKVENTSLKLF